MVLFMSLHFLSGQETKSRCLQLAPTLIESRIDDDQSSQGNKSKTHFAKFSKNRESFRNVKDVEAILGSLSVRNK